MQRSLIAAAILATLGTSALAQSSVTMYGRLNLTLENRKIGNVKEKGLYNNASRIGMKGIEDLGGGLKAGFQIEHGFNADTGAQSQSAFWARQSEVNLSGGFGMVRLGNFTSEAYYATADYVSLHNHDTGSSSDALYAYIGRNTDKVAYRTPAFGGLTAELSIGLRDGAQPPPDRSIDLAVNYGAGPLHVGVGYEKVGDQKQFAVSGLYEVGALTFGGYVQRDTNGYLSAVNANRQPPLLPLTNIGNRTTLRLSGMYTLGSTELHANFGRSGDYSGLAGDTAATQYTFGVNQNLSKRTKVYGYVTKVSDKGTIYGDFQSLAVGVRHNF
jgi:predicted porin